MDKIFQPPVATGQGLPGNSGGGRGLWILLLQEIFGVNRSLREIADDYAEEGYVCLAPDLFRRIEPGVELGYTEAEIQKGILYLEQFDVDQALKDIDDALGTLSQLEECTGKIGALGLLPRRATGLPRGGAHGIDCAVSYYGINIEKKLDEASTDPLSDGVTSGERDRYAPAEAREQTLRPAFAAHTDVEFFVYPDCDHALRHRKTFFR